MSAGNVGTPNDTFTRQDPARVRFALGTKDPSATPAPTPTTGASGRDATGRARTSAASKDVAAIAEAVTGESNLTKREAENVVRRAQDGDRRAASSHTSNEQRTSGTHVGTRDARLATIRRERSSLGEQVAAGKLSGPSAISHSEQFDARERATRGMNGVADTLHVLGADEAKVNLIEDEAFTRVVPDDYIAGNAAYDAESGSILVSQTLADQAAEAVDMLHRHGIMDRDGRIVQGKEAALDRSIYGDTLVKIGTLIAYHEHTHVDQDSHGNLDAFRDSVGDEVADGVREIDDAIQEIGRPRSADAAETYAGTDAAWDIERSRIDAEEYDAYLAQEQADIQLGATLQVQLVTDDAGNPLDRAQGVANIVALERGRPLEHGPDAGWVRSDVMADLLDGSVPTRIGDDVPWEPSALAGAGATIIGEVPGWKRPGWKRPGWKRPGIMHE